MGEDDQQQPPGATQGSLWDPSSELGHSEGISVSRSPNDHIPIETQWFAEFKRSNGSLLAELSKLGKDVADIRLRMEGFQSYFEPSQIGSRVEASGRPPGPQEKSLRRLWARKRRKLSFGLIASYWMVYLLLVVTGTWSTGRLLPGPLTGCAIAVSAIVTVTLIVDLLKTT